MINTPFCLNTSRLLSPKRSPFLINLDTVYNKLQLVNFQLIFYTRNSSTSIAKQITAESTFIQEKTPERLSRKITLDLGAFLCWTTKIRT